MPVSFAIGDVPLTRDGRDMREPMFDVQKTSNLELSPVSLVPLASRGHRYPYSSGMVMAIPPITSLSLKSRFGLSR